MKSTLQRKKPDTQKVPPYWTGQPYRALLLDPCGRGSAPVVVRFVPQEAITLARKGDR